MSPNSTALRLCLATLCPSAMPACSDEDTTTDREPQKVADATPADPEPDATPEVPPDAATVADPCHDAPFIGYYCGESFDAQFGIEGGEPGFLYFCDCDDSPDCAHGVTTSKVECDAGCFMAPAGVNDRCN